MSIEELAFKDRKILANLNAVDLLNIIEFLQDDRRQCLEELSKTHNRSVEIQKENQELKSQLAGTTHCFDEEEHRVLKKQLENCYCNRTDCAGRIKDSKKYDSLVQAQEAQQKEFIKFLEDLIKQNETVVEVSKYGLPKNCSKLLIDFYKEILQKYKEITQTKNNNSV